MPYCLKKLVIIHSDNDLSIFQPNHYLNKCWLVVNYSLVIKGVEWGQKGSEYTIGSKYSNLLPRKSIRKCLQNIGHFVNYVNCHLSFFGGLLVVNQFWLMKWICAEQATGHCLNKLKGISLYLLMPSDAFMGHQHRPSLMSNRRQVIIWTSAELLSIGPLGTNFRQIVFGNQTFLLKKIYLKILFEKCWSFCLGLNLLNIFCYLRMTYDLL